MIHATIRRLAAALLSVAAAGPANAQGLQYERFVEPWERAFSIEVPKGWNVAGASALGNTPVDQRQAIMVQNPEELILIQFGDTRLSTAAEYQPSMYPLPQPHTHPYQPGEHFGRDYVDKRVRPFMPDLVIDAAQPLPNLSQHALHYVNAWPMPGVIRRADVGEVLFHGSWHRRPSLGYLLSWTTRFSQPGVASMWSIGSIGSLKLMVANRDQIGTAIAVMNHMNATFAIDQDWARRANMRIEEFHRYLNETNQHMSDIISRTYFRGDPWWPR